MIIVMMTIIEVKMVEFSEVSAIILEIIKILPNTLYNLVRTYKENTEGDNTQIE